MNEEINKDWEKVRVMLDKEFPEYQWWHWSEEERWLFAMEQILLLKNG